MEEAKQTRIVFSRIKRRILRHVWVIRTVLLAAILGVVLVVLVGFGTYISKTNLGKYLLFAKNFVLAPAGNVKSFNGKTNILILGKSGAGYDAPDLTDVVILASVSQEEPEINLISLPRDIWIPSIRAKLNSAYYWGNQKQEGGGLILAKSIVEEIVGVPVHYALIVDFSGFMKVVDVMGGIEIDVERGFRDKKYPIAGSENDECGGDPTFACRYETVEFEKGTQKMDGERALKFVRSRNSLGDEGNDLARAARQQLVLSAIKSKLLDKSTILSPKKISGVWSVVKSSVETDIDAPTQAILARKTLISKDNISQYILPMEFLVNPPIGSRYDFQYVFIPKAGDWKEVQEWVKGILYKE